MKTSELVDKTTSELVELEGQLRDQLIRLSILKATQRATNTAKFGEIRRDIARIKTLTRQRELAERQTP